MVISYKDMENPFFKPYFYFLNGHNDLVYFADQFFTEGEIETYIYNTWGVLLTQANKNNLLYISREFDFDVGLQFNRMRYYSPSLGRFCQKDISFEFFTKYIYAESNSMNYFDPFGNSIFGFIDFFISITFGFPCKDWRANAACVAMAYMFENKCFEGFEECTNNCPNYDIDCLNDCWEEWASYNRAIAAFLCDCLAKCRALTCGGDSDYPNEDILWT